MAQDPTAQPTETQLDINLVLSRFQTEIAQLSARAIMAEAEVFQLRQQNSIQQQIIENSREQPADA